MKYSCIFVDIMVNSVGGTGVQSHYHFTLPMITFSAHTWEYLLTHTHTHTKFDDVHKHILLHNVDTRKHIRNYAACMYLLETRVSNFQRSFIALLICTTKWYLSSQTPYLLFSLRQSIDPKF